MGDNLFDLAPVEPKAESKPGMSLFDLAPSSGGMSSPTSKNKPLANAPGDEANLQGEGKNLATSVLTGMSSLAGGMEGDIVEAARRLAAGVASLRGERTTQQILDQWNAEREKANQARIEHLRGAPKPAGMSDEAWERARQRRIEALQIHSGAPANTEEVYKMRVAPKMGEYTPIDRWGEYGRAIISGAIPGLVGGPVGALAGATSGATSQFMNDTSANPFWSTAVPVAVGAVTPLGVKGASATRRAILGKNATEQQAAAAKLLAEQASNPEEAYRLAQERAGTPKETLAEATVRGDTGDQGLARTQDALLTEGQPDMVKAHQQLQGERAAAMSGTLSRISADSSPADVSAAIQSHINDLETAAAAKVPPAAPTAEIAGSNLTAAGQKRLDTHMQAYADLKKTIDPEGRMSAWTGDLNDAANAKLRESETRPLKTELGPVATKYLKMAAALKDVTKLNDLIDFDQNITQGLKLTHDTVPADYGVLVELKRQVKEAMSKALENEHKVEQSEVARGTRTPEDTFAARMQRERDDVLAREKAAAGDVNTAGTGTTDAGTTGGVPPTHGVGPENGSGAPASEGTRPGVGGPGNAGGPGGVRGNEAPYEPVTPEAAERLALSNRYYGKIKDTFGKGPVGKALDTEFGGQSKMLSAEVAEKAFVKGPKGYETAQMWTEAGGPEGLAALKDIATGRLQAELGNKPLDQNSLRDFKTKHADALRAIDEADAKLNPGQNFRFSDSFNDAATARTAVQEFQTKAVSKFLGMQPGDVVNHVSTLMQAKDSTPLRMLVKQAESMPDGGAAVLGGLRRAGAQWLQDNFEQHGIKNIRNLIANRRDALEALFDKDAVATMEKVNDSIDKSATVQALANRDTPGSPTEPRAQAIKKLNAQLKATTGHDIQNGAMNTASALVVLELMSHIGHSVMAGDLRSAVGGGLGLAGTLMVKPMLERALERRGATVQANITRMLGQGFADRDVGAAMLKQVLDENGKPNQLVIDTLADALIAAETSQQKREQHAAGGVVGDQHTAAAKHLVSLVDRVRKRDAERTKPLLNTHDSLVAHALAIANRSI